MAVHFQKAVAADATNTTSTPTPSAATATNSAAPSAVLSIFKRSNLAARAPDFDAATALVST